MYIEMPAISSSGYDQDSLLAFPLRLSEGERNHERMSLSLSLVTAFILISPDYRW